MRLCCSNGSASTASRRRTGGKWAVPVGETTEPQVRINQVEVTESGLDVRQLRLVLAWAELHREELLENWRRARAGETLAEIDPLR